MIGSMAHLIKRHCLSANRTFGCGPTPSVYSRVSDGYDWLRWTICQTSSSPPAYLDCDAAVKPDLAPKQAPPDPPNPIKFKWTFTPDDNYFESGKLNKADK